MAKSVIPWGKIMPYGGSHPGQSVAKRGPDLNVKTGKPIAKKPAPSYGWTQPQAPPLIVSGGPLPIPIDPSAENARINADRAIQTGLGNRTYQQGQLSQNYGYNAQGQRDYSNPYSRAALLQESYGRSKTGTTNSYAGQGQLYSGAYGRMQGENDRNYSIGSDQLQRSASQAYGGLDQSFLDSLSGYGTAIGADKWAELMKALGR